MNEAIICLGSNTPDAPARLMAAEAFVSALGYKIADSGTYPTEPEYAGPSEPYLNELIVLRTGLEYERLRNTTKEYENTIRTTLPNEWAGLVNLDIDIVIWNDNILRPSDASAAYFRQGLNILKR